jgi:FtsZ-interacting cell division protein ZipA
MPKAQLNRRTSAWALGLGILVIAIVVIAWGWDRNSGSEPRTATSNIPPTSSDVNGSGVKPGNDNSRSTSGSPNDNGPLTHSAAQQQPQAQQSQAQQPQAQQSQAQQPQAQQPQAQQPQAQQSEAPQSTAPQPESQVQKPSEQQPAEQIPENNRAAQNQPSLEQSISPTSLSEDAIRAIQTALDESGFKVGRIDGLWGPETDDAVRKFQQSKQIQANGQLDQQTLSALGLNSAQIAQQSHGGSSNRQ